MATVNLGRVGIVNKGTYVGATTVYKVNDIVKYIDSVYICIQAHSTENIPSNSSAYWNVWVDTTGVATQVTTITSLRAMTATPSTVYVTGYTTANDNAFGSNFYKWNSTSVAADNGGTIIKLTNTLTGRYELQYNGAVNVKWFGADVTGVADSTTSLQNAINATQGTVTNLFIPAGLYQTTATLTISSPIQIDGVYSTWKGTAGSISASSVAGTVIYFNHLGKGISINGTIGGVTLNNLGTLRNQPTPASGWVPIDADYDIYVYSGSNINLTNIELINPTKGIQCYSMGYGKSNIYNLRMQAFQVGIFMDAIYDTVQVSRVHQWTFWSDDAYTQAYTKNNLKTIWLQRVDNPFFSDIFSIFAANGIRFSQSINGATSKFHGVNIDLDLGSTGILVDSSVTSGVTAQLENYTAQGSGVSGVNTTGIDIEGNNSTFLISNAAINSVGGNAVRVYGTGNNVQFGNFQAYVYNASGLGFPAIEAGTGNTVNIANNTLISGGGTAPLYGGAGVITGAGVSKFLNPLVVPNATATNHAVNLGQLNLKAPLASPAFTGTVTNSQNITALPTSYDSNECFRVATSTPTSGVSFTSTDGRIIAIGEGPNGPFIRTAGNKLDLSSTGGVIVPNATATNQAVNLGQLDQVLHVREEQPTATDGGDSVAGNQVRVLNTVVRNTIVGASLATNQITLPAGKYSIVASAPSQGGGRHRIRLVNQTDSVVLLLGTSEFNSNTSYFSSTNSIINSIFALSATKNLNITHYIQTAAATTGLGVDTNDTFVSVYTSVYITKIG